MRVTIIPDENRVNVEGFSETVDCSSVFKIDPDIHVVQWYSDHGEIEYFNPPGKMFGVKVNKAITDFAPFQSLVDAWEVAARAS